jgi:hypothetical protein
MRELLRGMHDLMFEPCTEADYYCIALVSENREAFFSGEVSLSDSMNLLEPIYWGQSTGANLLGPIPLGPIPLGPIPLGPIPLKKSLVSP